MEFNIRPWNQSDLTSLVKYANNRNVSKYMIDKFPFPYKESDGRAFIDFAINNTTYNLFAIIIENCAVGGIAVQPQEDVYSKNIELGYWIGEPFWGKGIATEAVKQMIDFSFSNYKIDRIFAKTFSANIGSHKVLEKVGFKLEGTFEDVIFKNNEYYSEHIYAVRRKHWNPQK